MENSFLFEFHIEFTFAHHAVCKWQPMMMMFASTLYYVVHKVIPSRISRWTVYHHIHIFHIDRAKRGLSGSHVCTLSAPVHELPSKKWERKAKTLFPSHSDRAAENVKDTTSVTSPLRLLALTPIARFDNQTEAAAELWLCGSVH